jgi:hypothetical protein
MGSTRTATPLVLVGLILNQQVANHFLKKRTLWIPDGGVNQWYSLRPPAKAQMNERGS